MNLTEHTWIYKNALSKRICNLIIQEGLKKKLQIAETGFSLNKKRSPQLNKKNKFERIRSSNVNFFESTPWLGRLIDPYIADANKSAKWNFDIIKSEVFQFTEYNLNQHYNWHKDSFKHCYPPEHKYAGLVRKLSTSIILSDNTEYEGGDLHFSFQNTYNKIDNLRLKKLEIGTIVVFPSFLWHKVNKVTKGKRYSLVNWYLGEKFK